MLRCLLLMLCTGIGGCTHLFFFPMKQEVRTPADIGLVYEDIYFADADGPELHGWYLPAAGKPVATVLFLHGNAENISTHIGGVYWLPERGFDVFIFDYRGYGQSEGEPDVPGALADAETALEYLVRREASRAQPIIVYGQSLGGALAITALADSACRAHVKGLIVDSAFADYRQIASEKLAGYWLTWPLQWPLSFTIDNDYSPLDRVGEVAPIPLLIMHGEQDQVVPVHHARLLYERARQPKSLWIFQNGIHGGVAGYPDVRNRLVDYMERLAATE